VIDGVHLCFSIMSKIGFILMGLSHYKGRDT
jgi:hypothetical protein